MKKLFGTDGIRGIAGQYPITVEMAEKIGRVTAFVLGHNPHEEENEIIIGRDTRESGAELFDALAKGITECGIDVYDAGVIPTPAIAYLTYKKKALAGIVISASHNPYEHNGIKIFSTEGMKLPDAVEAVIERELHPETAELDCSSEGVSLGSIIDFDKGRQEYVDFILHSIPSGLDFSGTKAVIDCANGATFEIAPMIFKSLSMETVILNNSPDGKNINEKCGALYLESLRNAVRDHKADIGFAFDGDGDRVLITDENGSDLDGDHIMCMCAKHLKEKGLLKNNKLVVTTMSNLGLHIAMKKEGIDVATTQVGDKYVLEEMLRSDAVLGGEQSGHIIFLDYISTGDGMLTALQVLNTIREANKPIKEMVRLMDRLPQVLVNIHVKKKKPINTLLQTSKLIEQAKTQLRDKGRVLVRYSGTEHLARVMIEGTDTAQIERMAHEIADCLKKETEK